MSNHRPADLKRIYLKGACGFIIIKTRQTLPFFGEGLFMDCQQEAYRLSPRQKLKEAAEENYNYSNFASLVDDCGRS